MKIISIVNQKGGCGKTTLASLLIKALLHDNKKVLAIDADPQASLTYCFDIEATKQGDLTTALMDRIGTPLKIEDNFYFFHSNYKLDAIAWTLSPFAITNLIDPYKDSFDYVVIDCPPTTKGISLASIQASSLCLVPCEISKTALKPTLYTMKEIEELKKPYKNILIGYKEPTGKQGYQADLTRLYTSKIKNFVALPKSIQAVKHSTTQSKTTKSIKDNIYNILIEAVK